MKACLTKQPDGRWLLTRDPPLVRRVRGTRRTAAYAEPGDPLNVPNLCPEAIGALCPPARDLPPLQPLAIMLQLDALTQ